MVRMGVIKYKRVHIMVAIIVIFYAVCIPLRQVMALNPADDYIYTKYSDCVIINKYKGTATVVTIPSTIDGLPVTGLGYKAFASCTSLTR